MRILVVSGSLGQKSRTRASLRIVAELLQAGGAEVDFYDLYDHGLPLYDPDAPMPTEVKEFRERAAQADGLILGSPEYHNGMTGALKNALDCIGARQVKHKPVGLVAVAGGGKGGINALVNMRTVVRGILGLAVPEQVIIDEDEFDDDLNLLVSDKRQRLEALVQSVLRFTRLIELEKRTGI